MTTVVPIQHEVAVTAPVIAPGVQPLTSAEIVPGEPSYWKTPEVCHPGTQAFKCPITMYIIIIIIGGIIITWALLRAPRINRREKNITTGELWVAFFVGMIFYIAIALLFGWWVFERCRTCHTETSGITFLLIVLVPIALVVVTGILMGSILDVGFLLTASREPNSS